MNSDRVIFSIRQSPAMGVQQNGSVMLPTSGIKEGVHLATQCGSLYLQRDGSKRDRVSPFRESMTHESIKKRDRQPREKRIVHIHSLVSRGETGSRSFSDHLVGFSPSIVRCEVCFCREET
jgi:hypothetical protein